MFVWCETVHCVYRSTVERYGVSFPEKLLKIAATIEARFFSLKALPQATDPLAASEGRE